MHAKECSTTASCITSTNRQIDIVGLIKCKCGQTGSSQCLLLIFYAMFVE